MAQGYKRGIIYATTCRFDSHLRKSGNEAKNGVELRNSTRKPIRNSLKNGNGKSRNGVSSLCLP